MTTPPEPARAPARKNDRAAPRKTPDGRYIVVRGRLCRTANRHLSPETRQALVDHLMAARRAVREASTWGDGDQLAAARRQVQAAKVGLGERGLVW